MRGTPKSQPRGFKEFHETWKKVKDLAQQGLSAYEISQKLSIHHLTTERLLRLKWGRPIGSFTNGQTHCKMPEEVRKYHRENMRLRRASKRKEL